jgi:N-acyl-D-amino-acid deacylase
MSNPISRRKFIKSTTLITIAAGTIGGTSSIISKVADPTFDILIKNGMIIDGLGRNEFPGDIGIKNGKIFTIENQGILNDNSAMQIIDARGLKVSPGFIDIHSHTDTSLFVSPNAESKIRQGVTTEVAGQDGSSIAPRKTHNINDEYPVERKHWESFNDFFKLLEDNKTAVNFITFVGQGTVRGYVVGEDDRPATIDEIKKMKVLIDDAFEQGVFGISTGLEYTPGSFATSMEITELCSVMKKYGGIYATHMRNEDAHVLEAIEEAITIGKGAGVPVNISHLKVQGKENWHKIDQVLDLIEKANKSGIKITMDRYPYTAFSTGLSNLFPLWSRDGGTQKFLERLKDKNQLNKIKDHVLSKVESLSSWDAVLIAGVTRQENKLYEGKTIQQIVSETGEDAFDFSRRLLIEENGRVSMCGFGMSEENTKRILAHPLCMVASDGGARAIYGKLSEGNPHPRSYGTFPRFLGRYVREDKIVSLPEAIKKMSSLPAETLGISDRGKIGKGMYADIVCFDFDNVIDKANYVNPHQYPFGINYVLVNGEIVISNGKHTNALPGKILRKA